MIPMKIMMITGVFSAQKSLDKDLSYVVNKTRSLNYTTCLFYDHLSWRKQWRPITGRHTVKVTESKRELTSSRYSTPKKIGLVKGTIPTPTT